MKFKVGDRVAVYGSSRGDALFSEGARAVIVAGPDSESFLEIQFEAGAREKGLVHPKQCRRLVKKERRCIWVDEPNLRDLAKTKGGQREVFISTRPMPRAVEFVEVKKK